MTSPIPLLLCGKLPAHIKVISEAVKPEFRVIKACSSIDVAEETISALFKGEPIDGAQLPQPRAILMGGGFTKEEQDRAMAIDGAKSVPWFRPEMARPGAASVAVPPAPDDVARRLRKCLDDHYGELLEGTCNGHVWYF